MDKQQNLSANDETIHSKFSFAAHSPLTILQLNLSGEITSINFEYDGYSKEEIIGKKLLHFIDQKYHNAIIDIINKVKNEHVQLSIETSSGEGKNLHWYVNHFDPVIEGKKVAKIQVVIREITQSKIAIDALKTSRESEIKSEANLRTVFDNTRTGYVLLDKNLYVISFNKPAEGMTKDLFGKDVTMHSNLRDYFPEQLKTTLSANWNKVIAGEPVEYEKKYFHRDGSYHWYEINYIPVKNSEEEVINILMKFQDVTKRKEREQQLLDYQEERFKFAIEGSNDGIWDWNITNNKVYFSQRWKKMLDFEDDELKNEYVEWESRIHPDDKENVSSEISRAFSQKDYSYAVEHRLKCKNGEYKWILARGKVISWENEKPSRMAGTHTDISQKKEMEVRIANNEKVLAGILETLPVILFAKDINNDFKFSLWNKQAEKIFGLKAEDCIGKNDYDFFSKEDADFFRKKDLETIQTKGILDIPEETVQTPTGKVLIHTLKTVVRDAEGRPLYLLGVSENISELKKMNEILKVSEEKYRSLVENSPITIITTDKNELIQFINFTGTGRPINEIIGHSIYELVSPEFHKLVQESHKSVFVSKKPVTYETERIEMDGSKKNYQTHAGPMLFGDEVIGLTIFTRDITNRIENEERIKKSLKEKEILLQEVHHRVKNNLQIISSILNLQTRSIKDARVHELINETRYRIMSMSFIHDLLYQTKDFTNIDFSKYIQNITSNIMNTYTMNKNIHLKLHTEPILLNLDNAIPCGLIVNELITNAFKYAFPDGRNGEIVLELKLVKDKIILSVADNGVGISKKVNYQTTESLGFQLINSLVSQIDAVLTYESDNGTKFTVSFLA
jgi:PAS domain S-box-containing protein